jgi:hypothetical protein
MKRKAEHATILQVNYYKVANMFLLAHECDWLIVQIPYFLVEEAYFQCSKPNFVEFECDWR